MIDFALNLRGASEYTVYAERGVVERGNSEIRGTKADAMRSAEGRKMTKELANAIDAMRQLPCTELKSADLTGKVFTPGVYCLNAAELNGEVVMDGKGSAAGTFIFKVTGSLDAKSGSSIRVENGAQGGNVFFVASGVEVGDDVALRANVLTDGNIKIGRSTVTDKVMALGKVELNDSALLGGTTGSLEICKEQQLPVTAANDLSNRIFHYTITGSAHTTPATALRVAVDSCSSPIDVTAGPQQVVELNNGTLITPSTGTFVGGFELYDVRNLTPASPSTLGLVNLATRTANVNIVAGGVNTQLTLQFWNRRAITGFIEICKRRATGPNVNFFGADPPPAFTYNPGDGTLLGGGDPDVQGFFQYTIEDVYAINTQNQPDPNIPNKQLQVFNIPVGQCTGPISVTKSDPAPFPFPVGEIASVAFVSELPRAGAFLESVEVIPPDRAVGPAVLGFIVGVDDDGNDVLTPAPGGGYQDTVVVASTSAANETLLIFTNRSNPSRLKVCKVAGPGIPINTLFTFTVVGYGPTAAAHPQVSPYGIVTRTFDVRAGDATQGGACVFVPGFGAPPPTWNEHQTFVNGTPIFIFENGVSVNNTIPQNPGQLRASQIRVFGSSPGTGFVPAGTGAGTAGFTPNPDLTPAAQAVSTFQNGGVAIPDTAIINIPVNVPNPGLVSDVDVEIRANHTYAGDLGFQMRDPFNRAVTLNTPDISDGGVNYGTGSNDCTAGANPTRFDDEAATSINAANAPFAGSHQPIGSLSDFDGRGMNGTWTLRVVDAFGGDVGTLGCVRLTITQSPYVARAAVWARAQIVEVEFTNFRFNPTVLKVCKIGVGAAAGTPFQFRVDLVSPTIGGSNPGNMFPAFTQTITVIAGAEPAPGTPSQEGNCGFVTGTSLLGGSFNQGSTVTITELGTSTINSIYSLSAGPGGLAVDIPNRRATLGPVTPPAQVNPNGLVAGINSVTFVNSLPVPPQERPVKFDFDGDRKADPAVWTSTSGNWSWLSSLEAGQMKTRGFGVAGDKLVAADYDGDGKTDYAVYRPDNGRWYIQKSANGGSFEYHQWGEATDIPMTGDYNGDGKADFIIFRPSNGTWYVKTTNDQFAIFQFGIPSDKPYAADYDGDGRTDAGVFRNGTWYTQNSTQGFRVTQFGQAGDIPVPADYDGDGAADFAVYRNGTWFMLSATTYTVKQLGEATDVPTPADFDGDGKIDLAVFRPSQGRWYIKKSGLGEASSFETVNLGSSSDAAVQAQ